MLVSLMEEEFPQMEQSPPPRRSRWQFVAGRRQLASLESRAADTRHLICLWIYRGAANLYSQES